MKFKLNIINGNFKERQQISLLIHRQMSLFRSTCPVRFSYWSIVIFRLIDSAVAVVIMMNTFPKGYTFSASSAISPFFVTLHERLTYLAKLRTKTIMCWARPAANEASFLDKLYNNVIKFIVIREVKKNQIKNSPFTKLDRKKVTGKGKKQFLLPPAFFCR